MTRGKALIYGIFALIVLVVTVAPSAAGAAPSGSSESITVGEFAAMLANRVLPAGEAPLPAPKASRQLAGLGIRVGDDLGATLTAGQASSLFDQFGITLRADRPEAGIGRDKAAALIATFGGTLSARTDGTLPAAGAFGISNGRGSVLQPSLEDLTDCQNLGTVKECHTCCRNLGFHGRTCGQSCSNSPKASSFEPTP